MKIRELFSDESKWTQNSYARDKNGDATSYNDSDAVCFCLAGALFLCYQDWEWKLIQNRIDDELRRLLEEPATSEISAIMWNDHYSTTFADVKALVERLDI